MKIGISSTGCRNIQEQNKLGTTSQEQNKLGTKPNTNKAIQERKQLGMKLCRNDFKRENQTRNEINILTFANFFYKKPRSLQNRSSSSCHLGPFFEENSTPTRSRIYTSQGKVRFQQVRVFLFFDFLIKTYSQITCLSRHLGTIFKVV